MRLSRGVTHCVFESWAIHLSRGDFEKMLFDIYLNVKPDSHL